ncbi:MAG TPA: class I SAM-dependent methyltransferase [Alphaproteobacteria bacterium]|nr:class I SAM-dependent methyltransferase [Alphaproteobacteria bacterium]
MTRREHRTLVDSQFGTVSANYVASPVHAQGPDLEQLVGIVSGHGDARAIDLGSGGGHVAFHAAPHLSEIVAYDLSPDMLAAVAKEANERGLSNIRTQHGLVEHLPFPDASFDFVFSRYSAHHWRDVPAALREARRILKSDGQAIFMDAVAPDSPLVDTWLQSIELLRDPSHVRDYSVAEWRTLLRQAGFEPGGVTLRRLRLDFASWIARMRTPEPLVQGIRALLAHAPEEVAAHMEIGADGSFTLDTMTIRAR